MTELKPDPNKPSESNQPTSESALTRRDFLSGVGALVSGGLLVAGVAIGSAGESAAGAAAGSASAQVPLQIIVVATREEANEIMQHLQMGEPFGTLAKSHSIAPSAADNGYLGMVDVSGLLPEIRKQLAGLHPGQYSGVIETPRGYMIVKLLSETAASDFEIMERDARRLDEIAARVQMVIPTSGQGLVADAVRRLQKPANWNQNLVTICQVQRRAIAKGIRENMAGAQALKMGGSSAVLPSKLMEACYSLALFEAYQGDMKSAISHLELLYQINLTHDQWEAQVKLQEILGADYMHWGDLENGAGITHIESSILPILPAAKYELVSNIETSAQYFIKHLQNIPTDVEAKWLLNLAMMKLGKYPASVPPEYLIPPAKFESQEDVGRFVDIAPTLGLNTVGMAGGLIVDDFDNDGYLDFVTSSSDPCAPMRYFHNNGDGTFTDRSVESGLSKQIGGLNLIQGDYNNDSRLDILVLRGAWGPPNRKSLLRNNGDGTFTDVTEESGLAMPATSTQTAVWADYDNDGFLDLFVGNENTPCQLFHNKGDGTFVDVGPAAGIDRTRMTKAVVTGDYDNDGYPDFYVSNLTGENFLYHNNGDGTFTDVAKKLHVELPLVSFPAWFFDYNNDGWLDILVHSSYPSVSETVAGYVNLPLNAEGSKLYKNMGNGTFQDVSQYAGVNHSYMPMGSNFGDFDNDGFLDFYLGTGAPSYASLVPNVLMKNMEGDHFTDVTYSSRTGSLAKGHGVSFADIDNDGQVEVWIRMGGATPGDAAAMLIFKTPDYGNNWITLRLVGVKTNRCAIGARITVTVTDSKGSRRTICRDVGSGGSFGASPLQQHIGLGKAKKVESVEIWWPTSKTRQTFRNLEVNQFIEIKEFQHKYKKLHRRTFKVRA